MPNALLERVDTSIDVAVVGACVAELAHQLLDPSVLVKRFPHETPQLGIPGRPGGRVDDLLLEPRVYVELATDAVDGGATLPAGDVPGDPPYEARETASTPEAAEQLLHAAMVFLDDVDHVHRTPPL